IPPTTGRQAALGPGPRSGPSPFATLRSADVPSHLSHVRPRALPTRVAALAPVLPALPGAASDRRAAHERAAGAVVPATRHAPGRGAVDHPSGRAGPWLGGSRRW